MPRYALRIEYDGTPFHGWQRQRTAASVQASVEAALQRIEPNAGAVVAAGRTDAGVHATWQVAHVDLPRAWSPFRLSEALNHHLKPAPIAVLAAAEVTADFHARFDAVERLYVYRLACRRAPLALGRTRFWRVNHDLDRDAMIEGAMHLIGRHDFTTFRSSICQAKSPVKTLDDVTIDRSPIEGGVEIRFTLRARSFLHNQVRSIVGTLERVGAGAWAPSDVGRALAARNRASCGPVCPPDGLYLSRVHYDRDPFTPSPSR
ncbi:MAG: tRNA pseudouridine(38-40) synthase TruA [Pseudomonadota bacterium]